jgi:hypothetical protein
MTEENEKRIHAFYKATAPGHRESRAVPPGATRRIRFASRNALWMRAFREHPDAAGD